MADIKIDDIKRQLEELSFKTKLNENKSDGNSFSNVLKNAIEDVNEKKLQADNKMQSYINGENTSLHHTLISLEKADLSFKMMMSVRTKLLQAYEQIMKTSV
jgi:flagellar hook-basal body complex protein FliE